MCSVPFEDGLERGTRQLNTDSMLTEVFETLHIDLEARECGGRAVREDTLYSRNVWRKQVHWEYKQAAKKSKRKEEKIKRKINRDQKSGTEVDNCQLSKRVIKAITRDRMAKALAAGPKLCIDLSMTDCMSHKEISRLAGQIRRLYGSNRKAPRPFHLFLTDLREDSQLYTECLRVNDGFLHYMMDMTKDSCLDLFSPDDIVYLTPDAEEALESMDADHVYVLGGLVDESIKKKMSYQRAQELRVRTARLPIDEYMVKRTNDKNFHSKVLAINQVFDILLGFFDTGSWTNALDLWFPPGKGYVVAPHVLRCQCSDCQVVTLA
ncbi:tRNA methyltransferase 10 homolog B isoform X2 [Esox lucius]|uniref:tRNA methyltransferase 10 homolog B n=1 Tax=Esox lucius TaxID=8010 RepID=A0A3P8XEL8_ESOLU|nr:tRNA methyltransferase 10 homolog B isoform X2 [Esox lucius]